jgi:hypothetical protein
LDSGQVAGVAWLPILLVMPLPTPIRSERQLDGELNGRGQDRLSQPQKRRDFEQLWKTHVATAASTSKGQERLIT